MTKNIVLFDFEGYEVRTLGDADNPCFVAADVCRVLGLQNVSRALSKFDDNEKGIALVDTPGGKQSLLYVTESGLYVLAFKSRKPAAKRFRRWVTSEVLPSVRTSGQYSVKPAPVPAPQLPPETTEQKLANVDTAIHLFDRLGGMDERTELDLKDLVRNITLQDKLALPSGERTAWPISDRVRHLGLTANRGQLIRIGKLASDAYNQRYGYRPIKREQYVDGAVRQVCEYKAADVDLLDAAITHVILEGNTTTSLMLC